MISIGSILPSTLMQGKAVQSYPLHFYCVSSWVL